MTKKHLSEQSRTALGSFVGLKVDLYYDPDTGEFIREVGSASSSSMGTKRARIVSREQAREEFESADHHWSAFPEKKD